MMRGQNLYKMDGNAYRSYEFPRGGLTGVFVANVIGLEGSPTVSIDVEHRNADETSSTTAGSFSDVTTTGVKTVTINALKEILSIMVTFDAGDASTDGIRLEFGATSWLQS